MISRLAACVFVAASIYGCAAKTQWAHPRKSADEFYADRAECNAMSGSGSGGGQVMAPPAAAGAGGGFLQGWNMGMAGNAASSQKRIYMDCMMGRGWRAVPAR